MLTVLFVLLLSEALVSSVTIASWLPSWGVTQPSQGGQSPDLLGGRGQSMGEKGRTQEDEGLYTHTAASSDRSYADLVCYVLLGCAFLPRKCLGWSALILRMSLEECAETQAARASSGFSCLHSPVLGVVPVQGLHVGLIDTRTVAICAHPPNTMPRCIIERSFKIW